MPTNVNPRREHAITEPVQTNIAAKLQERMTDLVMPTNRAYSASGG